jgi:hypothetical protein
LARVLHPEFGLFWPSPRFLRKFCIATAFIAGGVIAGTQGILLLSSEGERDARSAFALASPQSPVTPAGSGAGIERALPRPPAIPHPAAVTPSQRAEPKVIRVERKPMQSVEISTERKMPPPAGDRARTLAASPAQATSAPTLPENTAPSLPAESGATPPETAVAAVAPEAVTPPPAEAITPRPAPPARKVHRSASRSHSESWRSYSHSPATRPSGGYAGLW